MPGPDEPTGIAALENMFRNIQNIPPSVTAKALDAMVAVAAEKIRNRGNSMGVRDPESSVHILDTVAPTGKAKITATVGYEDITFKGTRQRGKEKIRNAAIAFINEYGKRGQPARPFIRTAFDADQEAICAPGIDIINDWIEKESGKTE